MFWPKELAWTVLKSFLAMVLLGLGLWSMEATGTLDRFGAALMDNVGGGIELIEHIAGRLPFLSYAADVLGLAINGYGAAGSFKAYGGYGVLHDFSKAVLLFLVVHFSISLVKGACDLLGKGMSPRTPLAMIYKGLSDMVFGMMVCISSMMLLCSLHDVSLDWWLNTFGSSGLSHWCYLGVLVALVAVVFVVLPMEGRQSLVDKVGVMLTDFGLSLCVVMLGLSLLMVARGGLGSSAETVKAIILPYIVCGAGLVILLRVRFRNT